MESEIRSRPAFAHLMVRLNPGESVTAEAGAMASMSAWTRLTARWNGGFFGAVMRRIFGGETLFVNEVACPAGAPGPAEVILTQATPGDMVELTLDGNALFLQSGAFIAATTGVTLGVAWAGIASFLGGEGLFRLKVSGRGTVWIGGYGAITPRQIDQELIVDSGHLIAYEPTVQIRSGLAGGIFSSFFGGEGIVMRIRGPGRIYLQTRSLDGLAAWTNSHLL
jgi:uncharacterized protein (TIGR00266 family)